MSQKKTKWALLALLALALLGGALYYILTKKYYPKVEGIEYLKLRVAKDSAMVKAGVQVQNRVPLPIAIDSVYYTITDEGDTLGAGHMTSSSTLPALGDQVLDFKLRLDFARYRKHLQEQQGKDSLRLAADMRVFFDLPLLSQQSITLTRHLTVPVAKSPSLALQDLVIRSFSPGKGYSFLLKIDATNKNLPGLTIDNFAYDIRVGDSLMISGQVDSTFRLQQGSKLLQVPLQLKTSDAIALINKKLSGDTNWRYDAQLTAHVSSESPIFDSFRLSIAKSGKLDISQMGSGGSYLPTLKQVKRLAIDSDAEQTRLQANLVVHNPAPIPFYIDSASYFVRYQGRVIARGAQNVEKTLPKAGDQQLRLQLLVDESAYQQMMKQAQDQQQVPLDISLNLLYNLPGAKRQQIHLQRQLQVPVAGQAGLQVAGLEVKELSPGKGAYLGLKLQVGSTHLPDLRIRQLDYTVQFRNGIRLEGHTQEPITVSGPDAVVEVPVHLSADDLNQLIQKAISGSADWHYQLQASATLQSSNKILGPTKISLESEGDLNLTGGKGGQQFMPRITSIDTVDVTIAYDTAWVKLNINVQNPLPVDFYVDSLIARITHRNEIFAISRESIGKVLPANGSQTAWITLAVNYGRYQKRRHSLQAQDTLDLQEAITLVYRVENLEMQQATIRNAYHIPMSKDPLTQLEGVKLRGISLRRGIVLNALLRVRNSGTKDLEVKDVSYNFCVTNLLDACGSIHHTYDLPLGESVVKVPISLGVGEVFRALWAKFTGNSKQRTLYLNTSGTLHTANPKLQHTHVQLEKWKKTVLFKKKG